MPEDYARLFAVKHNSPQTGDEDMTNEFTNCTDCDYCGNIGMCREHFGGTQCRRCARKAADQEAVAGESEAQAEMMAFESGPPAGSWAEVAPTWTQATPCWAARTGPTKCSVAC